MVVGSSTAFAGVFTYHADGFVVVFFFGTGRAVAFAVVAGVFITASRPVFFVLENVSAVSARELLFVATHGAVVSSVGVAGGTIPSFALTTTTATQHKGF